MSRWGWLTGFLEKRRSDADRDAVAQAWATSRFSWDDLSILLSLIQLHDHRLEAFGGAVAPQAVLDAVLADAAKDPILAGALKRAGVMNQAQRTLRVAES